MKNLIYHFVLPEVWAKSSGENSYQAESLATEGFIHCSFENQIEAVLERYFKGAEKVLILHIDTDLLTSKFVVEPSTKDELYPHIYGAINREAIIGIEEKSLRGNE